MFRSSIMAAAIVVLLIIALWPIVHALPSNTYYLIELDKTPSANDSFCSNIFTKEQTYRLPNECHQHLLCDPYYCDEKSFRCVKIRETLCCLHRHIQSHCRADRAGRIKDLFRSVYFQMSIEHGYCEINLERIEKADQAYCIAEITEEARPTPTTTTTSSTTTTTTMSVSAPVRSTYKHFHRRPSAARPGRPRYRVAARQNYSSLANLHYLRQVTIVEENLSSARARMSIDLGWMIVVLALSALL